MPITPATKPAQPGRKRISLKLLLDQLDQEWEKAQPLGGPDADLLAYYHSAIRVALHWIDGDPYAYQFPRAYQGERLAKVCAYLQRLETADSQTLIRERDRQVTLLRERAWPQYAEVCAGMTYEGTGGTQAELTYTWAGIDSLWGSDEGEGPKDAPPPYLPRFYAPESETFHCCALAVLYLNRANKLPLTDLDITPF